MDHFIDTKIPKLGIFVDKNFQNYQTPFPKVGRKPPAKGPGSMHVSPGPAQGVPIQKTPSPVRSSVLPGPGSISSPKSGGGDFRSSTPHDGEAVSEQWGRVRSPQWATARTSMSPTGTP